MEVVYFTVAAVVLYFAADRLLNWIEVRAGQRLRYRSFLFFGILLALAVISFSALRWWLAA